MPSFRMECSIYITILDIRNFLSMLDACRKVGLLTAIVLKKDYIQINYSSVTGMVCKREQRFRLDIYIGIPRWHSVYSLIFDIEIGKHGAAVKHRM